MPDNTAPLEGSPFLTGAVCGAARTFLGVADRAIVHVTAVGPFCCGEPSARSSRAGRIAVREPGHIMLWMTSVSVSLALSRWSLVSASAGRWASTVDRMTAWWSQRYPEIPKRHDDEKGAASNGLMLQTGAHPAGRSTTAHFYPPRTSKLP